VLNRDLKTDFDFFLNKFNPMFLLLMLQQFFCESEISNIMQKFDLTGDFPEEQLIKIYQNKILFFVEVNHCHKSIIISLKISY
jgi:hypothetical protein